MIDGILRQSTAVTVKSKTFRDRTDAVTAETGLTIQKANVRLDKNGAAMAAASANQGASDVGASHDALGKYDLSLDTTDTNTLGLLGLTVDNSNALPIEMRFLVVTAAVWDSWMSTGVLPANVTQLAGVTQSLTDLKDFADTGYDPATHKVAGVVLTDTATTLTGHTPQTGDSFARIGATGSGLTSLASAANLTTLTGYVDTEVASLVTDMATVLSRLSSARAGYLDNLSAGAVAQASALSTVAGYIDTEVAGLVTDMATVLSRLTSLRAGYLDNLSVGAVAQASALSTVASYIDTEVAGLVTDMATLLSRITSARAGYLDNLSAGSVALSSDIATLLARLTATRAGYLDNLSAGAVAQASALATVGSYVDTEIAAIIAAIAVLQADTDDIQTRLPSALVGGRMDSNISAINNSNAAAIRQALAAGVIIPGTVDSTAFSPTTTQFEADDITTAAADHYNGRVIIFTSGSLIGQATSISDYALATGRGHFTVPLLTAAPADNVTFIIV
jgi:uncharacterized protein YejL (UPF0352 family)